LCRNSENSELIFNQNFADLHFLMISYNFRKTTRSWGFPILVSVIFFTTPFKITGQNFEVATLFGGSNYQGDLADGLFIFKETQPCVGVSIRYLPESFWALRLGYNYGTLRGSDLNSTDLSIKGRGFSFKSRFSEMSVIGEILLNSSRSRGRYGIFQTRFTPFLFGGLSFTALNGRPQAPADRFPNPFPEENARNSFLGIPVGLGARVQFSENFALGFEGGLRAVFSDYLDGVSKNGNPTKNDWYLIGGLTLHYIFSNDKY
jgi:hypothetical protein